MGNKIASRLPYLALGAVCVVSLVVRSVWIGAPCHTPCRTSADHVLIFDERYYVNAARVIAGIRPATVAGVVYRHAPLGSDPNAEHPQLVKLVMAGFIELLGDGPWAWRLGSLLFGTLAILGMYALVRSAGGGRWLGVGAAALMAADNLMIVQCRIGTLEVYVVAAMVWAVALYGRPRPFLAGVVAGIGARMKLFAFDVVLVLALWELLAWRTARRDTEDRGSGQGGHSPGDGRRRLVHLGVVTAAMAGSFIALLAIMGLIAPPYDNAARQFVGGGPFGHLAHMITYAAHQTGVSAAGGIASYPWQWLVDFRPIPYLTINPSAPGALAGDHPQVHFLGLISPPILLAGLLGMALALWASLRRGPRPVGGRDAPADRGCVFRPTSPADRALLNLAAAWFLGTFVPFLIASAAFGRTTYLFYMTIVMPGMYVAAVWLVQRLSRYKWLVGIWVAAVAAAAIVLYPLTPLP